MLVLGTKYYRSDGRLDGPTRIRAATFKNACVNYRGFCTSCRRFTRGMTELDAEGYECPKCKQKTVMGAENAMVCMEIEVEQ